MSRDVIDVTEGPTWGHGLQTLAQVLEREHIVVPWVEPIEEPRPLSVRLPWGGELLAPANAVVRWRGDCVLILAMGVVRVVTARGEIILDAAEEIALRAAWPSL